MTLRVEKQGRTERSGKGDQPQDSNQENERDLKDKEGSNQLDKI